MKFDSDLEEIIELAWAADPVKTEYRLSRIMQNIPDYIEDSHGYYEIANPEYFALVKFISLLRSKK